MHPGLRPPDWLPHGKTGILVATAAEFGGATRVNAPCKHRLPGFRATFLTIGLMYVLMALSLFARGMAASMAPFGVPAATLASPHYLNAISWVYLHQIVLGVLIVALGIWTRDARVRVRLARLLLAAHAVYAWLDFRASDSFLGTGLYRGAASLFPALFVTVAGLLLLHLSLCRGAVEKGAVR